MSAAALLDSGREIEGSREDGMGWDGMGGEREGERVTSVMRADRPRHPKHVLCLMNRL